jgi:amino acid transporter
MAIPGSDTSPALIPKSTATTRSLTGSLGVGAIIMMVVAAASPLTVMAGGAPIGFLLGNGVGFPALFLVAAAILMLFAVGLTAMTRYIPKPGTFFIYVAHGLGRTPGLAAAYLAMLSYTAVQLAVYAYMGEVLRSTLANFGFPGVPWWVLSLIVVGLVGILGYFRIDLSSKVLGVLLLAEVGILLALVAAVTVSGGAEGLSAAPFEPPNIFSGAPGVGLMIAMSAFIGFEAVAVYRDEAKDPDRTIPRATFGSVLVIGVFCTLVTWGVVMAWGPSKVVDAAADPATMLLKTSLQYLGPFGEVGVNALLITSLFACVLSLHNVSTRYQHALALAGILPEPLGKVHTKHGSPYFSSIVQTIAVFLILATSAILNLDPVLQIFTWLSGATPLAIAVLMALTSVAIIAFFRRTSTNLPRWKTLIAPILGFVGLFAAICIMIAYFPLLVGDLGSDGQPAFGTTSYILLGVIMLAPVVGVVQALILQARKSPAFERISEVLEV